MQGVNKAQFQDGRPKQKRHRCRNPNKIDVNSLTGEERVQIINRRNARKVRRGVSVTLSAAQLCGFLLPPAPLSIYACVFALCTDRWCVCSSSEGFVPIPPGKSRVWNSARVGRRCQTVGENEQTNFSCYDTELWNTSCGVFIQRIIHIII